MSEPIPSIVDAHVHLWDPRHFRMPWLDGDTRLDRPYGVSDFEAASAGLNVEAFVYVQVDVTAAYGLLEARWAADQNPAAIVAFAPLEDGAVARSYLDELVRIDPRIHGVRRLIQSEADPDFPVRAPLLEALRMLPEYGLSFDICIRHEQLASTVEMVRACPDTTFVLDHLGKPPVRAGRLDPWREQIAALAALPNVTCKVSGLVNEADHERWTTDDLVPYVAHVLEAFGEDRVLFGGDWPVVTHAASYSRWVETLHGLTAGLLPTAQQKLWRDNARRVYKL